MATSSLRRLSSQINRIPSLSPFTKSILTRSSATASAKVSDRIVKLSAIDPGRPETRDRRVFQVILSSKP
ncbi:hypothetical protein OIU77_024342 [Salix suchowensis]|uniref:Ribosomal protein S12 n=1 Tax=Salix suchowensis TaxID=1278906 RepID=A0ABQ9BVC3_9ROSI|nr:hypothetical protein OIU77_024342 [Salix suchowensis]